MLLLIDFRPAAPGQEGKKGKEENKADDEQECAADLVPVHPRGEQDNKRNDEEEQQKAHIPEDQRGKQETDVEDDPGPRVKPLDKGSCVCDSARQQHRFTLSRP